MKSKYLKDYKWKSWGKYLKSIGSSLSQKSKDISFGISGSSGDYSKKELGKFLKKTLNKLNKKIGTSFSYKKKLNKSSVKIFVVDSLKGQKKNTLGYADTTWWTTGGGKVSDIQSNIYMKKSISQFKETLLHEMGHTLGLKHPFESSKGQPSTGTTYSTKDTTTLMAYGESGNYYKKYQNCDIKALKQIWS